MMCNVIGVCVCSGGFRGGSEVSMEPPFLAKSKIDRYTKATVVG